jgi:predicted HTH domain antitoxin
MKIEISDSQLSASGLSEDQLRLEFAVLLFEKNILTLGKAAEFCGLHKMQMQAELDKRGIPVHYTTEMFEQDMLVINKQQ